MAHTDPITDPTGALQTADPTDEKALLQKLIMTTNALREDERQYWLDLVPNMSSDQMAQLRDILQTEQENVEEIDQKYDQKLRGVGEKYLNRWDSEKARADRIQRKAEEEETLEASEKKAEELLENW